MPDNFVFDRYAASHQNPSGPGDARPTAIQIIEDDNLTGTLSDKVVLVTGGSSGIGVETIRAIAHTGAHVIVGVRNLAKGQGVIDDMVKRDSAVKVSQLELLEMDLNSLDSIRKAAAVFLEKHDRLDILVNNAGIAGTSYALTPDGYESQFAVNHLSHFLLFHLLKPTLLASSSPTFNSRVISVSSLMHRFSPTVLPDPNFLNTPYDSALGYASSKTANIWFANELDRRYGAQGLHALSLHPGGIETGLQNSHEEKYAKLVQDTIDANPGLKDIYKSVEQGAATTVLAAVGKAFEGRGGLFLDDCQVAPAHDPDRDSIYAMGYARHAFDEEGEAKLWEMSLDMVGVTGE